MNAALEFLRALEERWPAHPPRKHALVLTEDGRLGVQIALELFYWGALDASDMDKPVAQLLDEIAPLLAASVDNATEARKS